MGSSRLARLVPWLAMCNFRVVLAYDPARCTEFVARGHCHTETSAAYMARHCSSHCSTSSTESSLPPQQLERRPHRVAPVPTKPVLRETVQAGFSCEPWCTEPCTDLNGDVTRECNGCSGAQFRCQPGSAGYPGEAIQAIAVSAAGRTSSTHPAPDVLARPAGRRTLVAMAEWADAQAARLATSAVEFENVTASCAPYYRPIGAAKGAQHATLAQDHRTMQIETPPSQIRLSLILLYAQTRSKSVPS